MIHALHQPTREEAEAWSDSLSTVFHRLYGETEDGELPDALSLRELKRRVRSGEDRRYLEGTRTKWAAFKTNHPEGSIVHGCVVGLPDFGAFVLLAPRVRGLIHISEISYSPIKHPQQQLSLGQDVEVRILEYVEGANQINLSRKRALPDPWRLVDDRMKEGGLVEGVVERTDRDGVHVDVGDGIIGVVPLNECCEHGSPRTAGELPADGSLHFLRVERLRSVEHLLRLSIRKGVWDRRSAQYPTGTVVHGTVVESNSRLVLEAEPDVRLRIPDDEIDWWFSGGNLKTRFDLGTVVRAIVIGSDGARDRPPEFVGSIRQLSPDPWPQAKAHNPLGSVSECTVVASNGFACNVRMGDVPGLILQSDLVNPRRPEAYPRGDHVRARVVAHDDTGRRILLSERSAHGLQQVATPGASAGRAPEQSKSETPATLVRRGYPASASPSRRRRGATLALVALGLCGAAVGAWAEATEARSLALEAQGQWVAAAAALFASPRHYVDTSLDEALLARYLKFIEGGGVESDQGDPFQNAAVYRALMLSLDGKRETDPAADALFGRLLAAVGGEFSVVGGLDVPMSGGIESVRIKRLVWKPVSGATLDVSYKFSGWWGGFAMCNVGMTNSSAHTVRGGSASCSDSVWGMNIPRHDRGTAFYSQTFVYAFPGLTDSDVVAGQLQFTPYSEWEVPGDVIRDAKSSLLNLHFVGLPEGVSTINRPPSVLAAGVSKAPPAHGGSAGLRAVPHTPERAVVKTQDRPAIARSKSHRGPTPNATTDRPTTEVARVVPCNEQKPQLSHFVDSDGNKLCIEIVTVARPSN